jgi:hypothetical protein
MDSSTRAPSVQSLNTADELDRYHRIFAEGCMSVHRVGAMLRALHAVQVNPDDETAEFDAIAFVETLIEQHALVEAMLNDLPIPQDLAAMKLDLHARTVERRKAIAAVVEGKAVGRTIKAFSKKPVRK